MAKEKLKNGDGVTNEKRGNMGRIISHLQFSSKIPDDGEILGMINELARLRRGSRPKEVFRQWLYESLERDLRILRDHQETTIG